jgi:Carboxypeptidase regulatory-like domain
MNKQQSQIFADTLERYKRTFFCLGASFCYLLAGQPQTAVAAPKDNQEPQRRKQNIGKLINELNARCGKKSLLDKLKSGSAKKDLLEAGDNSVIMVGGDTCPGTNIPAGTSFSDADTTVGANNTVNSIQAGCSDYTSVNGPDKVYRFVLPALGSRIATCTIQLTTSGTDDLTIYTLRQDGGGCPFGTGNAMTNCQNGADQVFGGGTEVISDAEMDAMPAGIYYLFVDSFYPTTDPDSSGPYTLNFNCTTLAVPTAAGVSVSGRVISTNGSGLSRIIVSVTASNGQIRTVTTNSFGFYKFDDLGAGDTYVFQVSSKKYQFSNPTQIVSVSDNIADLNFNGIE